jgi:predicted ATPase/DNA-binding CsgD family transcriptional regulator
MAEPVSSPGSAPTPRTRLVGRETDRTVAQQLLLEESVPLLTLTGPGGVGKTRLALAVAGDVAAHFADGLSFVDLSSLADPDLVVPTVGAALGVIPTPGSTVVDAIVAALRPAQRLVVLDNCEHLLPSVSDLVAAILAGCPAVQVLATSRAPLRVQGEHVLSVPPLPLPHGGGTKLDVVQASPAVCLFAERARAVDAHFALSEQNAGAVTEICQRLDGLPLAIELAAARAKLLSPAALAALLGQRLQVLGTAPRDAPARHQTMQRAIAWSYELLSPEEQRFFRRLAVFSGGWTLEAAAAAGELTLPAALNLLEALAHQSLVTPRTDPDALAPRFSMLETIREFGLERLRECGEEDDARDRHAAFFRSLIAGLRLYVSYPGDRSWFGKVAPEEDNLRQALEWFLSRGDALALSELSSSLMVFWLTRWQLVEGRRWLELAIARDDALPAVLRARTREAAGLFIGYHGDLTVATPILEEAVTLARGHGDPALLRHALYSLGTVALLQRDFPRAMTLLEDAERAARDVDPAEVDNAGLFVGATLCLQGVAARWSGDPATAMARFAAAEPYLRAPGGSWWLGMILGECGVIQATAGELDAATSTLVESVALSWGIRNDATLTRALRGLAAVAATTDQRVAAGHLIGAADALDRTTPFAAVAESRDRDIIDWCYARFGDAFAAPSLRALQPTGAGLTVEQAVALARDVAESVLGADRVKAIWQAAQAPDPGALPQTQHAELRLIPVPTPTHATAVLTVREREVLALLCQRMTDLEISDRLYISLRTANRHVSNILAKLDAANRRDAAAIAARLGLV